MTKFRIDGAEFCNALKRATSTMNPKGIINDYSVFVSAFSDRVNIFVDREKMNLHIFISAKVESEGEFMLTNVSISKLTGFSDEVIVEADDEKVTVRNGKKSRSATVAEHMRIYPVIEAGKCDVVLTEKAGDLIEAFTHLDKARQESISRPVHAGFHFNTKMNRIEAVDSYRVHMRHFDMRDVKPFVVPGDVFKHLKAVADKKDEICVCRHEKYVSFSGKDFVMHYKLLDGEFLDVDKIARKYTRSMVVDSGELNAVCKEYNKIKFNNKYARMHICGKRDTVYTGTSYNGQTLIDDLCAKCDNMDGFNITMNPQFVIDATSMFDGEVEVKFESAVGLFSFSDHTGKFEALVVPVRSALNDFYIVLNEIAKMRGETIGERESA